MQDTIFLIFWLQLFHSIHLSIDPFILFYITSFFLLKSYYELYRNDLRFQKTFYAFVIFFTLQFFLMCYCMRHFYNPLVQNIFLVFAFLYLIPIYLYLQALDSENNKFSSRFVIALFYAGTILFASLTILSLLCYIIYLILFYVYNRERALTYSNERIKLSYRWMFLLLGAFLTLGLISYITPIRTYEEISRNPTQRYQSYPSQIVENHSSPERTFMKSICTAYTPSSTEAVLITTFTTKDAPIFCREMEITTNSTTTLAQTSLEGYFLKGGKWYRAYSFQSIKNPKAPNQLFQTSVPTKALMFPSPRQVSKYVVIATYRSENRPINYLEQGIYSKSIFIPFESQYLYQSSSYSLLDLSD